MNAHPRSLPNHPLLTTLALCVAVASCASSGASSGGGSAAPRASADHITFEELQQTPGLDLFTAVQRLRPQWLQVRGGVTAQGKATISIFLDGVQQQGSVEILKDMRTTDIQEMRFMNARDATTRYGTDMAAGAIEIVTRH
jgi:hypothetical protein